MAKARAPQPLPFFVSPDDPPSKREILKAALALFVEHGLDGVTIRDIATRSGYTNPAIFKFFAGRDDLAEHLFVACYRELSRRVAATEEPNRDVRHNMRALVEEFSSILDDELDAFLFVTENLRRLWPRVSRQLRGASMLGIVQRLIERGRSEGELPRTIETRLLVAGIAGTMQQVARLVYFGEFTGSGAARVDGLDALIVKMCS
jgi:TetR/AcrR family transcriptional regulator, repressor of fatR-cypB operon